MTRPAPARIDYASEALRVRQNFPHVPISRTLGHYRLSGHYHINSTVWPCLVLSSAVLPCLVLHCVVLPCLVLPCLGRALPCLALPWPCLALPCLVYVCVLVSCIALDLRRPFPLLRLSPVPLVRPSARPVMPRAALASVYLLDVYILGRGASDNQSI